MFLTLTNPNLLESEQIKTLTQSVNAKYITHKHNKKGQYFFLIMEIAILQKNLYFLKFQKMKLMEVLF